VIRSTTTRAATAAAATVLLAFVTSACDTGDGKQLQSYDPADYPAPVDTSDVSTSLQIDDGQFAQPVPGPELAASLPPIDNVEAFTITAPWVDGQPIDARHTCDGLDVSPALSWGGVPAGTVEIAVALVDDSAVSEGQPFVHWVIAGLDPAEIALVEDDVPPGAVQALNFFGDVDYGGPCPPPGDDAHQYRLTAYALNTELERADGTLATELLDAIAGVTIRSTDLIGTYQR
jgi:Raf kinase inhibitor-like YbhB/YbcL family protein